uniref:Uncharacterized protein n=1 Tax=Opuntia streptacantha TaxID=393608 RepID=A0A7C9D8N9_OPUST
MIILQFFSSYPPNTKKHSQRLWPGVNWFRSIEEQIIIDLEHQRVEGVPWNDNRRLQYHRSVIGKPDTLKFNQKKQRMAKEEVHKCLHSVIQPKKKSNNDKKGRSNL